MRTFFWASFVALIGSGCARYYSQTPIVTRPRDPTPLCTSAGATPLSPTAALFVTRATVGVGSVTQEVRLFVGSYSLYDLVVPEGNYWRLAVEPICRFDFGRNIFSTTAEHYRLVGGFEPGLQYTALVISRAPYGGGTVDVAVRSFRLDGRFRPRQYHLDGYGVILANEVVHLPSVSRRLGGPGIGITLRLY